VTLGVRPGDLRVVASDGGMAATVERIEDLGDSCILSLLDADERPLKLKSDRPLDVAEGAVVAVAFAPEAAHLFDATTGARL
jgi:multiple sugar transport system ATP-binding protein